MRCGGYGLIMTIMPIYRLVFVGNIRRVFKYLKDPYNQVVSGSVYNISLNSGRSAYFGEKYLVKKVRYLLTSCPLP